MSGIQANRKRIANAIISGPLRADNQHAVRNRAAPTGTWPAKSQTEDDDRGAGTGDDTHQVTITDPAANTDCYYEIVPAA